MAFRFALPGQRDLPFIWNVSKHAGHDSSNPNMATHVELAQFFIAGLKKAGVPGHQASDTVQ